MIFYNICLVKVKFWLWSFIVMEMLINKDEIKYLGFLKFIRIRNDNNNDFLRC